MCICAQVMDTHRETIEQVFDFYVGLKPFNDKARRTMDLDTFTKLIKDANISNAYSPNIPAPGSPRATSPRASGNTPTSGRTATSIISTSEPGLPPPELLWMHVIRRISPNAHLVKDAKTELKPVHFGVALQVLAAETYEKRCPDYSPGAHVELLLLRDIVPGMQAHMQRSPRVAAEAVRSPRSGADVKAAHRQLLKGYESEKVDALFKKQWVPLQKMYSDYVGKQPKGGAHTAKGLTLPGIVELAKDHDLLPYVPKHTVRHIFMTCFEAAAPRRGKSQDGDPLESGDAADGARPSRKSAKEPAISFETFVDTLKGLAETLYGSAPYSASYPTPESRVDKLFAKLFVLAPPPPVSAGGW